MTPRKHAHDWTDRAAAAILVGIAVTGWSFMLLGASCVWRCLMGGE